VVVTEGLGPQPFHGRVVILVNQHSSSAAEMLAAFAQENHLATIVGTKTPGRLLSGGAFKAGHGFILGLPTAGYLTWQGTMLEGKGIEPDHPVELSYEALREGRDTQMEKAIEVVRQL
jgi:carboxyl-terminal processing protease